MNRMLAGFVISLMALQFAFSQLSEKIDIFISGGATLPVESVVGKSLSFPQLNYFTGTDFATNILGLTSNEKNFQDYWKNGFNIGAGMNYHLTSFLTLSANFAYNHFEFNKNQLQQDMATAFQNPAVLGLPFNKQGLDIYEGSVNNYELKMNALIYFPLRTIRPYLVAGGGYLHTNQDPVRINYYDEPFSDPLNATTVAFYDEIPGSTFDAAVLNAGAGLLLQLKKNLQPFIQAEYNLGLTKDQNTLTYPIKLGFVFSL